MAGQHIAELAQWTAGMHAEDVRESAAAWQSTADALGMVQSALDAAAPILAEGFGDSDIAKSAPAAFQTAAKRLTEQQTPMLEASGALEEVRVAMSKAVATSDTHVEEPGPAPRPENYPGIPIVANVQLAVDTAQHVGKVAAYNSHDAQAGERIAELKKTYAAAVTVMTKIHGDPYIPVDADGSPGGKVPTGSRPTPGGVRPVRPIGTLTGDDDGDGGRDDGRDDDRDDDRDPTRPPTRDPDNGVDENWPVFDPDPIGGEHYPGGPNGGSPARPSPSRPPRHSRAASASCAG